MHTADPDTVLQSFGRCVQNEQFFEHFYDVFRSKSEKIRSMFEHTDMKEQRRLLRAGITWMIMYSRGSGTAKLKHLGNTHNRHGYNIEPHLYGHWIEALVESVASFDPKFDPTLGEHWRTILSDGVKVISDAY